MADDLSKLRIDRSRRRKGSSWASRWILTGIVLVLALGAARFFYAKATAAPEVEVQRADVENARVQLERTRKLATEGVLARQALDDAVARYDSQAARVASLDKTHDLVKIGPRVEQVDNAVGQIEEAKGRVAYFETLLD